MGPKIESETATILDTSGVVALVIRRMCGGSYKVPDVIQYASHSTPSRCKFKIASWSERDMKFHGHTPPYAAYSSSENENENLEHHEDPNGTSNPNVKSKLVD